MNGPYRCPPGIHFICRGCGTPCDPLAADDRGGLCARCAFPTRVTRTTHTIAQDLGSIAGVTEVRSVWINGVEVAGTREDPDPLRRAIDRACAAWAHDNPEDKS